MTAKTNTNNTAERSENESDNRNNLTAPNWLKVSDIMSRYVSSISVDSSAAAAIEIMSRNNVSCLIVLNDAAAVGILTETDLLGKVAAENKDFDKTKISQLMSSPLITVGSDTSAAQALSTIQAKSIKRLPILDKNRLVGIVTLTDLLKPTAAADIQKKVSQIMTSDIATVDKQISLTDVARLISEKNVRCVIAVEEDKPVGILTKPQLLKKILQCRQNSDQLKLEDIMSKPVKGLAPDCSIFEAEKLMKKTHRRIIPVIDGKKIAGVISQIDILKAAAGGQQKNVVSFDWLENSKHPLYVADHRKNTLAVNSAFMKLLEISDKSELIGKPTLPEKFWDDPKDRANFLKQLNQQPTEINEITLKTAGGQKISVAAFTSALPCNQQQPETTLTILYNINTTKKQEDEKSDSAEDKNSVTGQAKGEFLTGISHEIRTSVNAIIGFSDVLISQDINAEQKQYVHIIKESSEKLLGLLNDIIDLSKIEAGKLEPEVVNCSLEQILAGIEALMRPPAKQKGIRFEVLQCGELPSQIKTDPQRLRQCLVNLIENAIKLTERGYVYVNVSMNYRNDKPYISFDIEDTSVGIPEEKQQNIFDIFSRPSDSAESGKARNNLGLAITKQLANLLDADLSVKSEVNKGSVFSFNIPVGLDVKSQPPLDKYHFVNELDAEYKNAEKLPRFTGKILVAEDSRTNQILINILLMKMGIDAVIVEDGKEAVHKALSESFDLVIMDIQMPHMDGCEATRTLRSKGFTTPIIALTAHVTADAEQKCLSAGCDEYMTKPVNIQKLSKVLANYLPADKETITDKIDSATSQVDQLGQLCLQVSPTNTQPDQGQELPGDEKVIDWDYLLDLCDNEDIITETVAMFLKDSPKCISSITDAIESENFKYVRLYAHSLKGAALSIGARKLSQKAYALELAAQEKDDSAFPPLFEEVHNEFDKLVLFLGSPDWSVKLKNNIADTKANKTSPSDNK